MEILSPSGNFDKLKTVINYGANAVYLGGEKFGLRAACDNFTELEIEEALIYAHQRNCKVYVVLNSFLFDKDLKGLPEFIKFLESIKVDAVIVSDIGVFNLVKENSDLSIHISTQASVLNIENAKIWKTLGAKRIILGREVSIEDAAKIKKIVDIEVEIFIHGSMCISYSGHCVISNYTSGRDSNRGGCAHSCRFEYKLSNDFSNIFAFPLSSKDLRGIKFVRLAYELGIDSLKIEGRMKSNLYAATTAKAYSEILIKVKEGEFIDDENINYYENELTKIAHRDYCTGNLVSFAGYDSIYNDRENEIKNYEFIGIVKQVKQNEYLLIEVRKAFHLGDDLEVMPFSGNSFYYKVTSITDIEGDPINKTKPTTLVKTPYVQGVEPGCLLRVKIK